ncbi:MULTISPECIES: plasmid transfer protein TraB [unclassified Streptomyces]|uniref:plasmid transfer protein TraB n=1 Tax=unclassified Streptomyces TaxID=2593676 RepID=UPI0006FCCDF2|nr:MULTISPECIES: plasmid transfer protein TraB [unclassified Streptomyces]KQX85349.1 sporulation protein SsgA [Streptomyces sp. Root1319]KQZ09956.1 sporulation protein SsgA [Streptomyces sp. Root55]
MKKDRESSSSTGGSVGAYLLHRTKPHLPPWLGVGGIGLVGTGAHLMWAESVGAGVGLTLSAVALTGATWWAGRETSAQRRLHSAITVAAGSAWVTGAALAGPLSGILPDTYLMGGAVLALSWNVRMALRTSDGAAPAESADKSLLAKVGLAKARIGRTEVEPNRVTAALALEGGEQTNDDVARALVRIASALDLPQSAVRYQPSADSARRGELVIVPRDMLGETVEWTGPSLPGGSIADPLVIGQYDDGSPLVLWLPGDPDEGRNASHFLIAGGTGSGKGDAALNLQTEILSRRDVVMWLSDPKAFQDFRPLLPAYDWAVEGGAGTEAMVEALQHVIPARTGWLGKHSYRQWTTQAAETQTDRAHSCRSDRTACGCPGMPYMVAWMEEAANTLRNLGDDAFTGIAQEARSAGVSLIVSLQRPSYDQMSTSTRASLPSVIALGCDPRDEGFSLPASVIDQGAHPGAWGNRRPGYCYVVSGGISEDRYASPGRTRRFTPRAVSLMETLAQWAVRNGATADPITAGAARAVVGRAYTGRQADTDETTEQTTVPDHQDDETLTGSQLEPEDAAMDPEQDLPAAGQGDDAGGLFGQDTGRKPKDPEHSRALFAQALEEFEENGQMIVGPKDFMDWCEKNNLSRPWVSARLREAAEDGRLQPTNKTGRWRIVPVLTPA